MSQCRLFTNDVSLSDNESMKKFFVFLVMVIGFATSIPVIASAHEVYVLNPSSVAHDIATPSPDPLNAILTNKPLFAWWAVVAIIVIFAVLLVSMSRRVEDALDPTLLKIKKFAPLVARLTLGISLIAAAYYGALFGPELSLALVFPHAAVFIRAILFITGICITFGICVRTSAFAMLVVYILALPSVGTYMVNYASYLGEVILSLILGAGTYSLRHALLPQMHSDYLQKISKKFEPYAFAILRVLFGIAIIYACWYAKLFHSNLALDTIAQYHLTNYFHFSPIFLTLGAMIIETIVGVFYILGFEIRFAATIFFIFLSLALSFFGEIVWPHIVLFGLNIAFFLHGYDRYGLEGRFLAKGKREPVL